jgi:hypothetical protein
VPRQVEQQRDQFGLGVGAEEGLERGRACWRCDRLSDQRRRGSLVLQQRKPGIARRDNRQRRRLIGTVEVGQRYGDGVLAGTAIGAGAVRRQVMRE